MGSGFFSQDNPPPAEQSPAGPGPGNVVVQEPTGVDGATASFYGRGAAPALQAFEEDAKAAAGEAAASAAAAAASAVASAASAGEALNVATGIDASVDQAEAAKNAAQASATNSANSATAAAGSASAANTSATQASTSATNAGNSATAAATSATNSATSAASAVSSASQAASSANSVNAAATTATAKAAEATASATNAANSATSASNSASTATTKAAEATTSASAAAGSATTAGASATAAGTSATNAANSASAAGTSATNAAASAATATTKASESSTSATNAASSATSAAGSATTATTKASEASTSATNAAASATTATTKASEASTSATNAANSASAAGTSATNAANSASAAGTSVTNAANSATAAAGSATAAAGSATAAAGSASSASSAQSAAESARDATLAAFDSFDDRYLGTKTSNPTVDNDGNALVAGALYFNSTAGEMRVWTGSVWTAAYVSGAGVLLQANNLSDLASASTARTNIGLGNVENKSSATIRGEITSSNVTTALGYTPANKAGDTFTGPVYVNNGSHQAIVNSDGNLEITRSGGGAYIDLKDSTGEDYDVRLQASGNVLGIAAPGGMTLNGAGVLTGITSGQVTTALGYTPYNATNPAGYITSSALSAYLPLTGGSLNVGGVSNTHQFIYNESGGEIQLVDSTGAGPILLDNSGGLARFLKVGTGSMAIGTTSTGFLLLQTNNTERMRIDSAGNVGIGTNAPVARLDVVGASGGDSIIANRASNAAYIQMWGTSFPTYNTLQSLDGSGNEYWAISGAGNANTMVFRTNSANERMRITSAGNVGIGTSSPLYQATVLGLGQETAALTDAGNKGGSLYLQATGITSGSGGALLFGTTFGNQTPFAAIKGLVTDGATNTIGDLAFSTRNAPSDTALTERMRILRVGNVGIGTSAPDRKLDVQGSGSITVRSRSTDTTGVTVGILAAEHASGSSLQVRAGVGFTNLISTGAADPLILSTNSAERMRVTSAGNVGIGMTAPPQLLAVGNTTDQVGAGVSGAVSTLYFGSPSTGSGGIRRLTYDRATGNFDFIGGGVVDPSTQMTITSTGNVGIGTTAPGAKLDVVGVSLTRTNSSGGSTPLVVRNDSSANNTTKSTGLLFQGVDTVGTGKNTGVVQCGPSDANYVTSFLAFQTRTADALNERMRINSDGQLLVGTTSGGRTVCINAADNWIRQSNPSRSWLIGPSVSTSYTIYDETAGAARLTIDTAGVWNGPNSIALGAGQNFDNRIEVGTGRTGNNFAYLDLIGDTTYTDYGLRLIRNNGGPNTSSQLIHRGTGDMYITTQDAAPMYFQTSGATRMYIEAGGTVQMNGVLLVGRNSASTDVNTANDTGSFSVRGSTTTVAAMSFHRAGAYAINMGLGTDNVFRIGGWSASSNAFQMDGSGNLTMLGNVTAYSDARMKKDVETIDSALDLVSKMRGVRYTRIDNDKRGVGVIAQEMLKVLPEVVQQGVGDDDTLSVAYGNLVGVLIEAIKELKVEVETLKGKNP